ncbi:hypothetical protein [Rhodoblastus sp.]|jgi:hypothetical protein|uniref:hypothetical protein n=1 Tax=Rhodoblastus sp. TaxID=1962975 RepID=UPI0025FF140E|nr:hypothetical protein [Rhodoblastus sp.]
MTKSEAKAKAQLVNITIPLSEAWDNLICDLKLTEAQAHALIITLRHVHADVEFYNQVVSARPERKELTRRLRLMEKAFAHLDYECRRNADVLEFVLPHDTGAFLGKSLTFSGMSQALGENVFPRNFDFQIELMAAEGTLATLEERSRPMREALGLKHSHRLLPYLVEQTYAPLKKWVELDRLNRGGRTPQLERRLLIYELARSAPDIIGKEASVAKTGRFVTLCAGVMSACGLPAEGLENAIPGIVKQFRIDESARAEIMCAQK